MHAPIKLAVLGAGSRATGLCSNLTAMSHRVVVSAVAEPRTMQRERFCAEHGVPQSGQFESWQAFFDAPRSVDAVLVATMDSDHLEPALRVLESGYHLLLEKPMAPRLEDVRAIYEAAVGAQKAHHTIAGVVHPLRFGPGFQGLKRVLDSGAIGTVVTLDHLEGIGWWHFAHSYVRGNWSRTAASSFALLAKSCHDVDYLCYLIGSPVARVSSFGSLSWFREENAPVQSTERCIDCPLEPSCPYSAVRWYLETERNQWPASVVSEDHSRESHSRALANSSFGRCVWRAGNDAVDHQTVSFEFANGITATMTMTAFSQEVARRTRVHGSEGEIEFDQESMTVRSFHNGDVSRRTFGNISGSHAGSDRYILDSFLQAIEKGDQSLLSTTMGESLTTHALTFAAEQARLEGTVVEVPAFMQSNGIAPNWPQHLL